MAIFAVVTLMLTSGNAAAQMSRTPAKPGSEFWEQIKLNDLGAVRFELGRGVDPNARHSEFGPAIVHAARHRAFDVTRQFARMRVIEVDAEGEGGETALMLTALHGDLPTLEQLLARGAQVNRPGWSPLHYAATGGQLEIIRVLIERHAFIDAESPNGTTPLMMAARMKHPQAVRLLIELGADPTMRNQSGLDAAAYLEAARLTDEAAWLREQAIQYLLRYGSVEQARRARAQDSAPSGASPPAGLTPSRPLSAPAGRIEHSGPASRSGGSSGPSPFTSTPIEREVLPNRSNPAEPKGRQ
jgi:hypothetical protein